MKKIKNLPYIVWTLSVPVFFAAGVIIGTAAFTPAQARGSSHPPHVTTLELSATRTCNDDGTQEVTWQTTTQVSPYIIIIVDVDPPLGGGFQFTPTQPVNTGSQHMDDASGHVVRARRIAAGEGTIEETLFRSTVAC